jgi:hypothetical protein
MQLTAPFRRPGRPVVALLVGGILAGVGPAPDAQGQEVRADAVTTVYRESGGPLEITVVNPSATVAAAVDDHVELAASWSADVVTGASVAVVDAPSGGGGVDAITSATRLYDLRNVVGGSLTLRDDRSSVTGTYAYGTENDYRSHSLSVTGRTELFDRNTALELSYGRGFDQVCNLAQPGATEAVDRQRLPSSDGCFTADDRVAQELSLQTFQGGWTQAWTPVLATQLVGTAQVLEGYQGNPYRAVWLGRAAAQENHPEHRARFALGLGVRIWLEPVQAALQAFGRAYRDSWDIQSLTAELAWEQTLGDTLRLRVRGRYYDQTGAIFYSDDYARDPRGQYFTGDRELSPFSSWTVGAQLRWVAPPDDEGRALGFLDGFELLVKADWIRNTFRDFRYGQAAVPNRDALVGTLALQARF